MKYLYLAFLFIITLSCSSDNTPDTEEPDIEPQPCVSPTGLSASQISESSATLNWNAVSSATYEIEFGVSGFTQGQGQTTTATNNSRTINGLDAEAAYQFYLRSKCGTNDFSPWIGPTNFTTTAAPFVCNTPIPMVMTSLSSSSKYLRWEGSPENESYTIEFGIAGFTLGNGQTINTNESSAIVDYVPAIGTYELYLKSNCQDNTSSDWVGPLNFFTNGSACGATGFSAEPLIGDIYSTFLSWGETWTTGNNANSWFIEYGPSGFELGTGTSIATGSVSLFHVIEDQTPATEYDYYIKGVCGGGGTSLYTGFITYTTPD